MCLSHIFRQPSRPTHFGPEGGDCIFLRNSGRCFLTVPDAAERDAETNQQNQQLQQQTTKRVRGVVLTPVNCKPGASVSRKEVRLIKSKVIPTDMMKSYWAWRDSSTHS